MMKFDVKCVREMLLSSGEVFTVRKWNSKNKYRVVEFEGKSYMVEKVRAVSGTKSIRIYVRKSGFDNVNDWWSAIKKFGALRGHLYHVTLMEDEVQADVLEFGTLSGPAWMDYDRFMVQELADCDRFEIMNRMEA